MRKFALSILLLSVSFSVSAQIEQGKVSPRHLIGFWVAEMHGQSMITEFFPNGNVSMSDGMGQESKGTFRVNANASPYQLAISIDGMVLKCLFDFKGKDAVRVTEPAPDFPPAITDVNSMVFERADKQQVLKEQLDKAKLLKDIQNGRSIFMQLFVWEMEMGSPEKSTFPSSNAFRSSNEYFVSLYAQQILEQEWRVFSGEGLPVAKGTWVAGNMASVDAFADQTNLWSVVSDLSIRTPVGTPVFISRNLDEPALLHPKKAKNPPRVSNDVYQLPYVLVIRMGGGSEWIPIKELTWERLNPTGAEKPILHPGSPRKKAQP